MALFQQTFFVCPRMLLFPQQFASHLIDNMLQRGHLPPVIAVTIVEPFTKEVDRHG